MQPVNLMNAHDAWDIAFKALAGILAIVGFIVGFKQYQETQKWKRAEVILGLIDNFKSNPQIQAACLMLDWDQREIRIDERSSFAFRNELLVTGLRILWLNDAQQIPMDAVRSEGVGRESYGDCFTSEEAQMRDCFDAFFDYFDKVNAFRRSALVQWSDLSYFRYWLELVRNVGTYKNNKQIQTTINDYLKIYDFKGFRELSAEYALQATVPFKIEKALPQ